MKLAIGTAYYEVKGYTPYIQSMGFTRELLHELGIPLIEIAHTGDSYVDRAKNALLYKFLQTDCTDLLIIDSDMSWTVEGLEQMLKAPFDCVGAAYPMKNNYESFAVGIIREPDEELSQEAGKLMGYPKVDEETGLIEAYWVPGGFLKLTRRCVERMYKAYECLTYADCGGDVVGLFQTQIIERTWVSEDVMFCNRWRQLGEKVWCEPRITFGHSGTKEWTGNYHDYLTRLPGGINSDKG